MSSSSSINSSTTPVFGVTNNQVLKATCFKNFVDSINPDHMSVESMEVRDSVLNGRFNWLSAKVENKMSGKVNSTFMLLRGDAVAVLPIVTVVEDNKEYIIATEQLRAPTGMNQIEAVAGMMDDNGSVVGQAIVELKEETGIKVEPSELIELGYYYSSQGIMDEKIHCFFFRKCLTQVEFYELFDKIYGDGEFEAIRLRLMPATWETVLGTHDAKMISAFSMYQEHLKHITFQNLNMLAQVAVEDMDDEDENKKIIKSA